MNTFSYDIMTFFFILICCLCSFLLILIGFILYILGSQRVRQALLAMSLIKTAIDVGKDLFAAFKVARNTTTKKNKNTSSSKTTSEIVDAEFRDKK